MRDSSTVWVNSFGAASTAVSSTRPSGPGEVEHRVLLRRQAGRQPLPDLVPDRRQIERGIGHAGVPSQAAGPPAGGPCRRVRGVPGARTGDGAVDGWSATVPHRCPQGVHDRRRHVAAPHRAAGRHEVRRRWSGPRSGPPDGGLHSPPPGGSTPRRDPAARCGATATLTAPSTARQRSAAPPPARRTPRAAACRAPSPVRPWGTLAGRRPAGRRGCARLGYAGRSPWPDRARSRRAPSCRGSPGRARRPASGPSGAPRAPARRRVGTADVPVVGVPREQAHVPAEQPPSVQDPRLPAADAYPRGPGDHRRPSAQGSREALRLRCCPRRHACAGVRSSPRSSGPGGASGGRPWCSTTSPSDRRSPAAQPACPGPRAGLRRRQGGRQLGGPPPRDPPAARRRPRPAATGCPPPPTWWCAPAPRRPTPAPASCDRDLRSRPGPRAGRDRRACRR